MAYEYAFPAERLGAANMGSFVPLYVQLADRISRLRQSVQLHERNVDALKRELAAR